MKNLIKCLLILPLLLMSCQENDMPPEAEEQSNLLELNEANMIRIDANFKNNSYSKKSNGKSYFENFVADLNEELLEYDIQISKMELLEYEGAGSTVIFSDVGNKQLPADFVPNDPRNFFPGTDVPFWTDGTEQGTTSGMTPDDTKNATYSAVNTWNSVNCSGGLNLSNIYTTTPYDIYKDVGVVQMALGFGGAGWRIAGSILHGGNLPAAFFDLLRPNGGNGIIGVTFTYIFLYQGEPSDIDQNGKNDVAFREIYMNDSFNFQNAPNDVMFNGIIDYETVLMHEIGHGLSQGHFGKMRVNKKGEIHFSPQALMNAGYSIGQREITGTDIAGHCSIWGNWPEK